ncbi:MAG: RecB family exonuclease, partial [Vicinamibacterales bacterium]
RPPDTAGSLVHRVLCDFFSKVNPEERNPENLLEMFETGWWALSPRYLRMDGVDRLRELSLLQLRNFSQRFDLAAKPFAVEPYFQFEFAPGVLLFGRVDRIDEERDGSLHIIDYKTGAQEDEVDAGQLRLYAIMVEQNLARPVSKISFWYLDDGSVWIADLSAEDKHDARSDLLAAIEEMEEVSEFPGTIAPHCAYCPYLHACALRDAIRQRREGEGW